MALRKYFLLPSLFLLAALILGVAVHRDFGVGWDESHNYYYGHEVFNKIMGISGPVGLPEVYRYSPLWEYLFVDNKGYFAKTHGPLFEFVLASIERVIGIKTAAHIYYFRHLAGYVLFVIALVLFYFLANSIIRNRILALMGCLALYATPRLFAHAFHDSYDTAFLAFFLAACLLCIRFINTNTTITSCLGGIAVGAAIDIRIMGLILIPLTVVCWALANLREKRSWNVLNILVFLVAAALTTYIFWPALWHDPFKQFIEALQISANDPWDGDEIYLGQRLLGREVPWHFTTVWMLATIPVLFTVMFVVGLVRSCLTRKLSLRSMNLLFLFGCLAGPLVAVAVLHSTQYNGWRHFYFVYPPFLVFALIGAHYTWRALGHLKSLIPHVAFILIAVLQFTYLAYFMIVAHPNQHVFFNSAIGMKGGYRLFETRYWGPEYRAGLEWLLDSQPPGEINVCSSPPEVRLNYAMLDPKDKQRIRLTKFDKADFFVEAPRNPDRKWNGRIPPVCWELNILGAPLVRVFDLAALRGRDDVEH